MLPLPVDKWWGIFDCSALEHLRRNLLKEKYSKHNVVFNLIVVTTVCIVVTLSNLLCSFSNTFGS